MKRNRLLIIISGIVSIFVILDLLLFMPFQVYKIRGISKNLTKLRRELQALEKDSLHKDAFVKEKADLGRKNKKAQAKFISREDASLMISEINRVGKAMSISILDITPGKMEEADRKGKKKFYYLPVSLNFRSGFHKLGRFINALENLSFYMVVKDLSVRGEFPDTQISMTVCGVIKE